QQLCAIKQYRATGRRQLPIHHIESGRLSCPVRADQGQQFARVQAETDLIDSHIATEVLGQAANFKQTHACPLRRNSMPAYPAIPWGNTSTISKITTPNKARQYSV